MCCVYDSHFFTDQWPYRCCCHCCYCLYIGLFWPDIFVKCLFQSAALVSVILSFVLLLSCFCSNHTNRTHTHTLFPLLFLILALSTSLEYLEFRHKHMENTVCAHGKFSINCCVASCARFTLTLSEKFN